MSSSPDTLLAGLRARILRIERGGTAAHGVLPLGVPAIDGVLPGGGLAVGAMHEAMGSAAVGFAALIAGRLAGPVLWCVSGTPRSMLYGPGLAALGLDPGRLVVACCASRDDMLWAMEEGLRDPALAAVIAEPDRPAGLTASRRLQLAAETTGVTGLILCRDDAARSLVPSAVFSRWRVDHAPALAVADARPGSVRWRLALRRCRGGLGIVDKSWTVEWRDATGDLALVPDAADRPAAAANPRRRRVG